MATATEAGTRIDPRPGTQEGGEATEDTVKRKGRTALPTHPNITEDTKLESVPDDYNPKVHASLKEDNFDDNHLDKFYDYQSAKFQRRANSLKGKAESFRKLGAMGDKKTGKKVLDHIEEMRELLATLAAQGEDMTQFADAAAICGVETKTEAA